MFESLIQTEIRHNTVIVGSFLCIAFLFFAVNCTAFSKKNDSIISKEGVQVFYNPLAVLKDPKENIHIRRSAAAQLIEKNAIGTEVVLLKACTKEPKLIDARILNYFGEKHYIRSVPVIQKAVKTNKKGDIIYNGIFALLEMQSSKINNYVFSYCKKSTKEKRYQCFLAIHDTENEIVQRKAAPLFRRILANKSSETKELRSLAKDFLKIVKKRPTTKTFGFWSIERAKKNKARKKGLSRKKQSASKKKAINRKKLVYGLRRALGLAKTASLLKKIDKNIKWNASRSSDSSAFVAQSYRKYFKQVFLSENLMSKGLAVNGSIHAVVRNIRKEYPKAFQSYSLSQVFGISDKEAKFILKYCCR